MWSPKANMRLMAGILAAILPGAANPLSAVESHNVVEIREFRSAPEKLWQAWSDPALVKQWWGPTGFNAPVVEMDFTEGGETLVCMQGPGTPLMCNSWRYTRLVENQTIEFESRFADENGNPVNPSDLGLPEGIPEVVPHRISLAPLPGGGTSMTFEEFGYATPQAAELSRQGLGQVLDKMMLVVP